MLRVVFRDLAGHRARVVMTLVAIALGVAATVAAWVVADSVATTLSTQDTRANVAVSVQGTGLTVHDEQSLAALPGVRTATGVLSGRAGLVGPDGKLVGSTTTPARAGTGWDDTGRFTLVAGHAPVGSGEIAVNRAVAGIAVGDTARVLLAGGRSTEARVVGRFGYRTLGAAGDPVPTVAFPPATAGALLGDRFERIELTATPGTDPARLARAAERTVRAEAVTGAELGAQATEAAEANAADLRETLLPFAAVALLVGVFLIANTFTMLLAQRTRQYALLRAVGARRSQVTRAILVEAAALGVLGGTVGVVAGIALGPLLITVVEPGQDVTYHVTPTAVLLGYTTAVVVTVLAAYGSARRAAATPPVAALRVDAITPRTTRRRQTVLGLVLLAAGVIADGLTGNPSAGTAARIVAILAAIVGALGVLLLVPVLATATFRALTRLLAVRTGPATRLGVRNAARDPRRTAGTAAAIIVGVGLVCAFATLSATLGTLIGSSVRDTIPEATTVLQPAVTGDTALTEADVATVRAVPGVRRVFADRDVIATFTYPGGSTDLKTSAIDPAALGTVLTPRITAGTGDLRRGVVVSENQAAMLGVRPGDTITIALPSHRITTTVAGVYRATELQAAVYLDNALAPEAGTITAIYATGQDPAMARGMITTAFRDRPDVVVTDRDAIAEADIAQQQLAFVVMDAMFGIAILIALVGVVNTLALSVGERGREIGVLRAIGADRRLIRRGIHRESLAIALFGGVLGIVLGVLVGAVMQHAMLGQELWTVTVPYGQIGIVLAGTAVAGLVAALWPAHRAAATPVLDAINVT